MRKKSCNKKLWLLCCEVFNHCFSLFFLPAAALIVPICLSQHDAATNRLNNSAPLSIGFFALRCDTTCGTNLQSKNIKTERLRGSRINTEKRQFLSTVAMCVVSKKVTLHLYLINVIPHHWLMCTNSVTRIKCQKVSQTLLIFLFFLSPASF